MFEKSIDYVLSTISETIKQRKHELHLRRVDILDDESLMSNIVNNRHSDKYPNLMSDSVADILLERLKFESREQMLWGNVDWGQTI